MFTFVLFVSILSSSIEFNSEPKTDFHLRLKTDIEDYGNIFIDNKKTALYYLIEQWSIKGEAYNVTAKISTAGINERDDHGSCQRLIC